MNRKPDSDPPYTRSLGSTAEKPNDNSAESSALCSVIGQAVSRRAAAMLARSERLDSQRKMIKQPRSIGSVRSVDYRRDGGHFQRCSRCHRERELNAPHFSQLLQSDHVLHTITIGNELIGFVCSDCVRAVRQHVVSVFPDAMGFPYVHPETGQLQTTPRCECGTALVYGRTAVCPQCDGDNALGDSACLSCGATDRELKPFGESNSRWCFECVFDKVITPRAASRNVPPDQLRSTALRCWRDDDLPSLEVDQ